MRSITKSDSATLRRGWVIPAVLGGVLLLGIVVGLLIWRGAEESKRQEAGRVALREQIGAVLAKAEAASSEFDFAGARQELGGARDVVRESPFADVQTYDALLAEIQSAEDEVNRAQRDYRRKLRDGWSVVEGRLVSAEERAALEAAARQRAAEEAARAAAQAERNAAASANTLESVWEDAIKFNDHAVRESFKYTLQNDFGILWNERGKTRYAGEFEFNIEEVPGGVKHEMALIGLVYNTKRNAMLARVVIYGGEHREEGYNTPHGLYGTITFAITPDEARPFVERFQAGGLKLRVVFVIEEYGIEQRQLIEIACRAIAWSFE